VVIIVGVALVMLVLVVLAITETSSQLRVIDSSGHSEVIAPGDSLESGCYLGEALAGNCLLTLGTVTPALVAAVVHGQHPQLSTAPRPTGERTRGRDRLTAASAATRPRPATGERTPARAGSPRRAPAAPVPPGRAARSGPATAARLTCLRRLSDAASLEVAGIRHAVHATAHPRLARPPRPRRRTAASAKPAYRSRADA
jgi:hypothetical protein